MRLLTIRLKTRDLRGFGCEGMKTAIRAAGALLNYAQETQRNSLPHIRSLTVEQPDDAIIIDPASRRNLEIDINQKGDGLYTLAWVLDKTATAMGSRLLRRWLNRPLRDHSILRLRQNLIAQCLQQYAHEDLHQHLKQVGDIERILSRVALGSARPRDLARLRDALRLFPTSASACPSWKLLWGQISVSGRPNFQNGSAAYKRRLSTTLRSSFVTGA